MIKKWSSGTVGKTKQSFGSLNDTTGFDNSYLLNSNCSLLHLW